MHPWFMHFCFFVLVDFITEGYTYRRYAASSLPLWGNTDVVPATIKENFWRRCRGGSSTSTRFLITNLISLQFTFFAICLSFSSPPLHKNLPFYSPLYFTDLLSLVPMASVPTPPLSPDFEVLVLQAKTRRKFERCLV